MAVSVSVTSYSMTEGNPTVAALMPALTYLRDMSIINWTFVVRWSGATKVTSITPEIGIRDSAGRQLGWLLGKEEKTTATSGTRTYTGQMFVPQISSTYGPGITSLSDGVYTVKFDFIVWNGSSGTGIGTPPTLAITYATLAAPTVSVFDVYRAYITGARADDGTYLRYSVAANVNKILATDTGTFVLRYRQTGTSTWTNITLGTNVASVNITAVQISGTFSISTSYECELVITDRYTTITVAKAVPTGSVLMHFKADKTGIGIGKYAETANLFDVALPTRLGSTVAINRAADTPNLLDVNVPARFRQGVSYDDPVAALRAVGVFYAVTLPTTGIEGQVCLVPV